MGKRRGKRRRRKERVSMRKRNRRTIIMGLTKRRKEMR